MRRKLKKVQEDFNILFIKDPHFKFGLKYPSGRKETYFKEIEAKVNDLIRIGREKNITKLGIAGDIFDVKQPSLWSGKAVTKNYSILQKLKEQFDIYTIAGNHDLIGSARSNKKESMYSHFVESGLLTDIHDKPKKFNGVYLYGIDFNSDISQLKREIKAIDNQIKAIKIKEPKAKAILMFHEHLYPNNLKDENERKFINSSFNYRYLGFTRLARSHYTLDGSHIPTAVHLSIKGGKTIYEDIPLIHKPFNDSIDIDVMLNELKQEMNIDDFLSNIEDFNVKDDTKVDMTNLPLEVKTKIEYYIEQIRS